LTLLRHRERLQIDGRGVPPPVGGLGFGVDPHRVRAD